MSEHVLPATRATDVLRAAGISFTEHSCTYEEKVSTESCARELNIDEHAIVKAIILEADGKPFMVLMHGDMRASTKELAGVIGAKNITPCFPEKVEHYTGYQAGGVSPFGTRVEMPVYMEETILNLRKVYINGGARGHLVGMDPYDAVNILHPSLVKVGSARAA